MAEDPKEAQVAEDPKEASKEGRTLEGLGGRKEGGTTPAGATQVGVVALLALTGEKVEPEPPLAPLSGWQLGGPGLNTT